MRPLPALCCALAALALAACGDDDEETNPARPAPAPETTATSPAETGTETTDTGADEPSPSPEEEEGGAGDEEPIRSEAVFTCSRARISPRSVAVPPYIAVVVRLEGSGCTLRIEGRTLEPGDSADLDGLRPQERYTGDAGEAGRVEVSASAEPGP